MKPHRRITAATLLTATVFGVTGCSILLALVGAAIDRSIERGSHLPGWHVDRLHNGQSLKAHCRNSETVSGHFKGLARIPYETYAAAYGQALLNLGGRYHLPLLRDTLWVQDNAGSWTGAPFLGFGTRFVSLEVRGQDKPADFVLASVQALADPRHEAYDVFQLDSLLMCRDLPSFSAVELEGNISGTRVIPADSIAWVESGGFPAFTVAGFLVGLTIDVYIVYAITKPGEEEPSPPQQDTIVGSCPHVFSFSGSRYLLDTQPFSGAFVRGLQRNDWSNIEHLVESDGQCRLRLSNGLGEADHVDAVRLMAVDHPKGMRIVADEAGTLHTLISPVPAVRAFDFRGSDVTDLLRSRDQQPWLSNPFGRNPDDPKQVRDGVTLDFTRPAGSARAKLAINIVNTPWAGMCLKRLLELVGRDLYGWYAELDAFPIRAHLVDSTMIRESGLQIWLRDGDEWQLQTAVRAVGSAVPEDHVVWLDVPATESDTLTIRLESTAGFWIIDEAVIDWSPDAVVTASECSLVSAVDWQRQDVRAALKEADGVYCELPAAGNDVETAFAAPSRISGTDRSYMLACAGYYTINVDTSAAPQPELIAQMATVPGAFGKYMLRSLEQQLTAVINR